MNELRFLVLSGGEISFRTHKDGAIKDERISSRCGVANEWKW